MKKYILHWWVYPSTILCFGIIVVYAVWFVWAVFVWGIFDGVWESLRELPSAVSYLWVPCLLMLGFSLLLIVLGTITFYLSDLRLRSYLHHAHRLPVLSATILFGFFHFGAFIILIFVITSVADKTESAIDTTQTAIYNMVETGQDMATDEAGKHRVEAVLDKYDDLQSIRNLMDPISIAVFVQYPIALILYALQARRIARDYRQTS